MFKELNHTRTDAIIDLIRTLPKQEQKVIVSTLTKPKPGKKLSKKAKKKQEILAGIAEGLREIKEAKRTGKKLPELKDLISELKNEG